MSMYAALLGERMAKCESVSPLGELLMCFPVNGAEAMKKRGWRRAKDWKGSGIEG